MPVEIEASTEINHKAQLLRRELYKETGRTTTKDAKALTAFGEDLNKQIKEKKSGSTLLPLIAFYGTARLWKDHKNTDDDKPLIKPRDYGYNYCLGDDSNYKAVYRWMNDAIFAELTAQQVNLQKDQILLGQLQAVRNALNILLKPEGYSNFLHINPYYKELAVVKHIDDPEKRDEFVSLPISSLSDGVRAVFSMVSDIAFRCAKLNPYLGEHACEETPGIILIDEIDQHLHPAWQQIVLDTLQIAFPKMQFIVTTHSPQVVSSVPKECVRIIDNGEVFDASIQTQGVESQDILTQIFGTDSAPQQDKYVQMLDEYAKLEAAGQADSSESRDIYQKLISHFGEQYAPLHRIEIHRKFMAKKRGGNNA